MISENYGKPLEKTDFTDIEDIRSGKNE